MANNSAQDPGRVSRLRTRAEAFTLAGVLLVSGGVGACDLRAGAIVLGVFLFLGGMIGMRNARNL